jgi:PAS domain S-box-containing protein
LSSSSPGGERTDLSQAILNGVSAAVWVLDTQSRVVDWNDAVSHLTGISLRQGQIFHERVLFPDDVERWRREFNGLIAGTSPHVFEFRWKVADGSAPQVACSCAVVRDAEGNPLYVVGTVINSGSDGAAHSRAIQTREIQRERSAELLDISQFIHNTVAQDLVVLSFHIDGVGKMFSYQPPGAPLTQLFTLVDRICRHIRVVSCVLAPPVLTGMTLGAAVEAYVEYVREETGLAIALDLEPVTSLSTEEQLLMFSAIQAWIARGILRYPECSSSIRLRSGGNNVVLKLDLTPALAAAPRPSALRPRASAIDGWSLIGERARAMGGAFVAARSPDGFSATLTLPERN